MADSTHLAPLRAALREEINTLIPATGRERYDLAERMTIVVTELASNALRHGHSTALVQLSRSATSFVLDVADEAPEVAPQLLDGGASGAGGRGLQIAQELTSGMGWYAESDCKHVWVQFSLPRQVRLRQAPRIPVFDLKEYLRKRRRLRP